MGTVRWIELQILNVLYKSIASKKHSVRYELCFRKCLAA